MNVSRKYTVFISSTFKDLKDERQQIIASCLKMGHVPIGMEMFSAGNSTQWDAIKRAIDNCDYYVVILADRYGSTIPDEGEISYTEKEYDYAVESKVPVMGLVLGDDAEWRRDKRESDPKMNARLAAFKNKVCSKMVEFWKDAGTLRAAFAEGFGVLQRDWPRDGWVPSTQAASPETANEIARLSTENESLRNRLEQIGSPDAVWARIRQVIEDVKRVPSKSLENGGTLFEFFAKTASAWQEVGDAQVVASVVGATWNREFRADRDALLAFELLRRQPSSDGWLTQDGAKILNMMRRAEILSEAKNSESKQSEAR